MAKITFITPSDERITLEAESGSLMDLAVDNQIEGIYGECGGACACATCHVHVAPAYIALTGEASDIERDMLELESNTNERSRLCCQIEIDDSLDGIELQVATVE